MKPKFPRIGIFSKLTGADIAETLRHLVDFLHSQDHRLFIEESSAELLGNKTVKAIPSAEIGKHTDLIIVVGGDGSLLKAARAIVDNQIPIVGINRGNLGFLADIKPLKLEETLGEILAGEYTEEARSLLKASIIKDGRATSNYLALNDVALHHGEIARLIEFEIYIDDQFVVDYRADGIITSTPTGSTAYALSGGGPIVHPSLDVLTLVPMFPHTLSARPIVIHSNSKIRLLISPHNRVNARISCDGQTHMSLNANDEILIQKHQHSLRLLHPKNYNYFSVLREKLGWNLKISN